MPPITAAVWDDAHYTSRPIEPYRPRAAEHTVLHRIVREHLATFLAVEEGAGGVPTFVAREFVSRCLGAPSVLPTYSLSCERLRNRKRQGCTFLNWSRSRSS